MHELERYVHSGLVNAAAQGPGTLDRSGSRALWRQLEADLHRRIDAAEFTAGFPGELALADEYAVSRQTVRLALRSLREAGVVTAHRGKAPRVSTVHQPLGTLYSLFASVEGAGMHQRSEVLTLDRRRDPDRARTLGLRPQASLVHLARIRFADDEPLAVDRAWLPAGLAAPLLGADFTHTALYREMADRCGVQPDAGHETVHAVNLDPEDADRLGVATGSAGFAIERVALAAGRIVEVRHTVVRGDRFSLSAQFSPSAGYRLRVSP